MNGVGGRRDPQQYQPPYAGEYYELSRLPHRRSAIAVNAPALTWHIGMRLGADPDPTGKDSPDSAAKEKDQPGSRKHEAMKAINAYLARLQKRHGIVPTKAFDVEEKASDVEEAAAHTLISERDSLFVTVGKFDCVRLRLRADVHDEYYTLTFLADGFENCQSGPGQQVREALDSLDAGDLGAAHVAATLDDIYDEFWLDLEARVDAIGFSDLPGRVFINIRGLALCHPHVNRPLSPRPHRETEVPTSEMTAQRQARIVNDVLRQFVDRRPNFFAAALGSSSEGSEISIRDANKVMCGMLDGAAIFGTSLRQKPGAPTSPLRYFIIYDGFKSEQLGRMIRRLHVVAELRMAALVDIDDMRKASGRIRAAGDQSNLSELSPLYTSIGEMCTGGLLYRINQSRYYAQVYRERLQDLRLVRIEGWQPYDEFVRRTIYRDFDFIDRLGTRYALLGDRVDRLRDQELGESIRRTQRDAFAVQKELWKLQFFAEPIGAVAFIYYATHILMSFVPGVCHSVACWTWLAAAFPPSIREPNGFTYLSAAVIYVFCRGAMSILSWRRRDDPA
ncbi:MAG: DUF3422 family protein [Rhizomicrobium sp.]